MPTILSPRFLALPVIALAVILALASASSRTQTTGATQVAGPTTVRAISCAAPANRSDPACAIVRDDTRVVR